MLLLATPIKGYKSLGNGVCRGKDGFNDMVNARANTGFASEAGCAAACDAVPAGEGICAGFAWQSNDENECILYGPGMAGACAAPNADKTTPAECAAVGTCTAPSDATTEDACGTCSETSAKTSDACTAVLGTWTAGSFTNTGVWELSDADGGAWTGDYHHTDHIHTITPTANFECFDKDATDHIGRCGNSADTPDGVDCAALFAAEDTFEADSCRTASSSKASTTAPEKCTWTPAQTAPVVKPAHPQAVAIEGYSFMSGACRSTSIANKADPNAVMGQDRPPYMYIQNHNFPSLPSAYSLTDLAAQCDTINTNHLKDPVTNPASCLGFHSGPTVSIFGPHMNENGPHLTGDWVGDAGNAVTTTLETTQANHQYICYMHDEPPTARWPSCEFPDVSFMVVDQGAGISATQKVCGMGQFAYTAGYAGGTTTLTTSAGADVGCRPRTSLLLACLLLLACTSHGCTSPDLALPFCTDGHAHGRRC